MSGWLAILIKIVVFRVPQATGIRKAARFTGGVALGCLLMVYAAMPVEADNRTRKRASVDFARDVYPILRRSCFECHGSEKDEAGLRLDRRDDVLDSGTIEAGYPEDSELLRRILLPRGHDEVMPAIGDPLPKRQVGIIRRWIQQGAVWPEDFEVDKHWAYVAPKRPPLPSVSDPSWARSPIDRFVLRRLDQEEMTPSPQATDEKLVRRLFLDLIGLPPSPEEVEAFVADPSDDRVEQLVDDLLSRPQFGERWARPWLDLARYADSHGFQRDNLRDVWAYRDWVIQALNDDMPFDQFTIEQIAGDLLPDATESQKIATGFHRCTPTNVEAGSLPEETRAEQIIDRVNTTGAVWLGTTLECCQCHDHKYDPFSMKDYYQLLAFYNNTEMEADRASKSPSSIKFIGPSMPLSDTGRDRQRSELQQQLASVKQQQKQHESKLASSLETWVTELSDKFADAPRTHVLDVSKFDSEGATDSFQKLDDGSILLVGGDPPKTDVYTVRAGTALTGIRGFRLDALQHDSLPGKGPGRGDPKRRNFVLNDFSVELVAARRSDSSEKTTDAASRDKDGRSPGKKHQTKKLGFRDARASFSQKNWDVGGAVDNDPKSGWAIAPEFDSSHWATFILDQPLDVDGDSELVFALTQKLGQARTIGCFRISAVTGDVDAESVPDAIAKIAAKPGAKWSKADRKKLLEYRAEKDTESRKLARQITQIQKQINQVSPDTTLVMIELEAPRMSAVFERGDYRSPGEAVQPGTPAVLHPIPEGPPNRLTLARWLASPDNPLVARVTVNRWWAELFGRGIVTTIEDFGIKGESPSHPDLLDWLAVEFIENGWSTKSLLKTIVLSATYQQSSRVTAEHLEWDDLNRWLARGPRFRMDAETIRDNALAISGLLNPKPFGPPIRPYQPDGIWSKVGGTSYDYQVSPGAEQHRRGIYVVLKRGSPYPSFMNFDATARLACTVKRSRTNTPLQALTLLNDPVYVEAANSLAARVRADRRGESLDSQLDYAFQLCTARQPTDAERETLRALFQQQQRKGKNQEPDADADAWFSVATTLLNLHETITKD